MNKLPVMISASIVLALSAGAPITVFANKTGLYPDIRTVVPEKLQLVHEHQRDILRFSNGIANTGEGPWALRPDFQGSVVKAIQEIRDANGNVVCEHLASEFVFHPAHNHWHIDKIAQYEVHKGTPTGLLVGENSIKISFCLLDWYELDGNSPPSKSEFWDCYTSYQGISVGWVDQYHQSIEGQQLDLTEECDSLQDKPKTYYLVSTANYAGTFLEKDYTNNSAWTSFRLYRDSQGNCKIKITGHSLCDNPGLCGENPTNR